MKPSTTTLIVTFCIAGCFAVASAVASEGKAKNPQISERDDNAEAHPLEGIWEQRFAYRGKWQAMLRSEVAITNGRIEMHVLGQNQDASLIPSRGISNVHHVLDTWTFDSDWGKYGVGNFALRQQTKDNYVGYAYRDGVSRGANEWVRVANVVARHHRTESGRLTNIYESDDAFVVTLVQSLDSDAGIRATGFEYRHPKLILKMTRGNRNQNSSQLSAATSWKIPQTRVGQIEDVEISIQNADD